MQVKRYINTNVGIAFLDSRRNRFYIYKKKKRTALHRVVYEDYYGFIPHGYQIHHKDGNKLNNNISNLVALSPKDHKEIHKNMIKRSYEVEVIENTRDDAKNSKVIMLSDSISNLSKYDEFDLEYNMEMV